MRNMRLATAISIVLLVGVGGQVVIHSANAGPRSEWQKQMDEARLHAKAGNNYVLETPTRVVVFYNNPDPFCYMYTIPGDWVNQGDNSYKSRDGLASVVMNFVLSQSVAGQGSTLVDRVGARVTQDYEKGLKQPLTGATVTPFESALPGTWQWTAPAIYYDGNKLVFPVKIIVDLSPDAYVLITVGATPDNESLAREIIGSLGTTSDSECYWPVLEETLRSLAVSSKPREITPLYNAAKKGDAETVRELLAAGADVNVASPKGATPLFMASYNGYVEIVRELLAARADANAATDDGFTCLYMASTNGHTEIVKELLAAGADKNASANGYTALSLASQEKHLEIVEELLAAGADVNVAAPNGVTALYFASNKGYSEIAEVLLAAGADANAARKKDGSAPLIISAQNGHVKTIKVLLAAGADVNIALKDGFTSLSIASEAGQLKIVKVLLAAGADVNIVSVDGSTALSVASDHVVDRRQGRSGTTDLLYYPANVLGIRGRRSQ